MSDQKHDRDEESFTIESQEEKNRREARNVKIGMYAIGGILLLSVFSAVASLTGEDYESYKGPAPEVKVEDVRKAYQPKP